MKLCNAEECQKPQTCRGYCDKHYRRWKKHGDPHHVTPPSERQYPVVNGGACSIEGCGKPAHKKGWCNTHYARWYRTGEVVMKPGKRSPTKGATAQVKADYVRQYKLDKGCVDCGYKAHHSALDFDHKPGTVKVRDIKRGQQFGWLELLDEIAKCDVVCANCHRIRTYNRVQERKALDAGE